MSAVADAHSDRRGIPRDSVYNLFRHNLGRRSVRLRSTCARRNSFDKPLVRRVRFEVDVFRGRLAKELPAVKEHASASARETAYRAKSLLVQLAEISGAERATLASPRKLQHGTWLWSGLQKHSRSATIVFAG